MTTLKSKNVSIRKEQKCFSCLRKFNNGTEMNYWAGIYDGYFNSLYTCLTCLEIMHRSKYEDEDGFPQGYVKDMLEKNETPEHLLSKL